jgi:hypothetical protein
MLAFERFLAQICARKRKMGASLEILKNIMHVIKKLLFKTCPKPILSIFREETIPGGFSMTDLTRGGLGMWVREFSVDESC